MRLRISRLLAAGIALSIVFHFTVGPLLVWLLHVAPRTPEPVETVYVATSSALRIDRRTQPHKAHLPAKPRPIPHPVAQPRKVTQPNPQPRPQPQQPRVRREIARIDRRSVNPPPAHSVSVNSPQQQEQFEKTIAQLRQENNPVISAARAVQTPKAAKRYTFDFSGSIGSSPQAQGILTPDRSWHESGYDYYYVRYWVQYADGSTETGQVPWPLRYSPAEDPFRIGLEHFPLPAPMTDFVLTPGTDLHPLVAYCLRHRSELDFCPIYHE